MRSVVALASVLAALVVGVAVGWGVVPRERGGEERAGASPDLDSLVAELERVPVESPPEGDGVLAGRILTPGERPVPGVLVRADPHRSVPPARPRPGRALEVPTLRDKVLRLLETHRFETALRREARTDEQGHYRLAGIAGGTYTVTAFLEGHRLSAADWRKASTAEAGDRVDFVAEELVELDVRVELPDGTAADAAIVTTRRGNQVRHHDWSRQQPSLYLDPGGYQVSATAAGDAPLRSPEEAVTLMIGAEVDPLVLSLEPRIAVRGTVHLPRGILPQSVYVYVLPLETAELPDPETLATVGTPLTARRPGYRFTLEDLAPGAYALGVAREFGAVETVEVVRVEEAWTDVELRLPGAGEALAEVRVLGPGGRAVPSAQFGVTERYTDGGTSTVSVPASRAADGVFRVSLGTVLDRTGRRPRAGSWLRVTTADLGTRVVDFDPETDRRIEVSFDEPARLAVELPALAGSGVEDLVSLALEPSGEAGVDRSFARTPGSDAFPDPQGRARLGPVQPGDYELVLRLPDPGDRNHTYPVSRVPVELASGENRRRAEIPPLYDLSVVVEDPSRDIRAIVVAHRRLRGFYGLRATVREDGTASFPRLPAGEYRVAAFRGGPLDLEMTASLPDEGVLRFRPEEQNALSVAIHRADGLLARWGLRDGDVVTAIDGEELSDLDGIRTALARAAGRTRVTLSVRRGEGTALVAIDGTALGDPRRLGGDLAPASR